MNSDIAPSPSRTSDDAATLAADDPGSDALFRTLLDEIPAAIAHVDRTQRYTYANPTYAAWFAPNDAGIEGRTVRDVLGEADYAEVSSLIEAALAGRPTRFERWLVTAAGERWIEATYTPRRLADGTVTGYSFMAHDLTTRHTAQQELARSERRLRTVIDNVPAMIGYWDETCRLVEANARFVDGLSPDGRGVIGREARELFGPDLVAACEVQLTTAAQGHRVRFEVPVPGRDGAHRHFQVTLQPDRDGNAQHGVFVFALDVTETWRLVDERTRELSDARDAAESANRVKDEIVANVSHELRTPLHAIAAFANLGLSHLAPDESDRQRIYFQRIRTSAVRLTRFVEDILRLARLGSGEVAPRTELTNLGELVREVVDELEPLIAQDRHVVRVDCPPLSPVADVDRHLMQRVLINLLSNARRFSPPGTEIVVSLASLAPPDGDDFPLSGVCRISVTDCGPGVPEHETESIFDPFVQSSLTDRKAGGTGLGLPIARRIVALHGGWLRAANRPQGGAVFELEIPVLQKAGGGASR